MVNGTAGFLREVPRVRRGRMVRPFRAFNSLCADERRDGYVRRATVRGLMASWGTMKQLLR
jgi:hypothetical protein